MLPRSRLDSVVTPDGRELALFRRGDDFAIQIGTEELMSSRSHGSEDALAELGLAALDARAPVRALVGGLGMGFTLRSLLDRLVDRPALVVVAELLPVVVDWNRRWLGELAGFPLDDPRVEVFVGDVADRLTARANFDLVLLDVDNGPEALTVDSNRGLYGNRGITRLHASLSPGAVVAFWSASPAPQFAARLARGGFEVASHTVRARSGGKGNRHVVLVGRTSRRSRTSPSG